MFVCIMSMLVTSCLLLLARLYNIVCSCLRFSAESAIISLRVSSAIVCLFVIVHFFAQDKGGPSKGGFLIHRLFSNTDLYLCNEIKSMCVYITCYSGQSSIIQETTFTRTPLVLARVLVCLLFMCVHHLLRATCVFLIVLLCAFAMYYMCECCLSIFSAYHYLVSFSRPSSPAGVRTLLIPASVNKTLHIIIL